MSGARVLSLGGGLDSWAMLLKAVALFGDDIELMKVARDAELVGHPDAAKLRAEARRGNLPEHVVMVDVGHPDDPGEWPSTYRHVHEVVAPYCAEHGIKFTMINHENYPVRDARSLFAWLEARKQIPVAGPNRICTRIAKVERFEKWLDDTYPDQEVEVWIGFEAGEESRASKDPNAGKPRKHKPGRAVRINRFPLIEWGMCRCRCEQLARESGHPVPRKSACTFCPYGTRGDWQRFAVDMPEQFARVVKLEADKPLTGKGKKLSIMAYNSRTQKPTMLPAFVSRPYTRKRVACGVCGAAERATKAVGCDYLPEQAA